MQWNIKLTTLSSDMNKKKNKKQSYWAVTTVKNNSIGYNNIATAAALEVVVMLNNSFDCKAKRCTTPYTHYMRTICFAHMEPYVTYAMTI